jgi:hypothetical protein
MTKNEEQIKVMMKIGFVASYIIELIDSISESNLYQKQLKFHLNQARNKILEINDSVYNLYADKTIPNDDKNKVKNLDVYNTVSKACDFLIKREPTEIIQIAQFIEKLEKEGFDLNKVPITYIPVK